METKFTPEQVEQAKTCKSVEELIAIAKENGTELTEAEATNLFAKLNPTNGELSDSELETVSGGCGAGDCSYCDNGSNKHPSCGVTKFDEYVGSTIVHYYHCKECNRSLYSN